jgi:hypothetical protein
VLTHCLDQAFAWMDVLKKADGQGDVELLIRHLFEVRCVALDVREVGLNKVYLIGREQVDADNRVGAVEGRNRALASSTADIDDRIRRTQVHECRQPLVATPPQLGRSQKRAQVHNNVARLVTIGVPRPRRAHQAAGVGQTRGEKHEERVVPRPGLEPG